MAEIPSAPKTPKAAALIERASLIVGNANPFLPGIGSAILSGVQLVQAIRIMRRGQGYFMGLGESCILILETLSRLEPRDDAGRTRLEEDAKLVEDVVRYIEKAVRSRSRKSSFLKRLWNYLTYKRIYEECQSRIENALHLLNLQAAIELREQVAGMLAASAPQTRVLQL